MKETRERHMEEFYLCNKISLFSRQDFSQFSLGLVLKFNKLRFFLTNTKVNTFTLSLYEKIFISFLGNNFFEDRIGI